MDRNWEEAGGFPAERERGGRRGRKNVAWAKRFRQDVRILRKERKWKEGLCGLCHCVVTLPLFQPLKAGAGRTLRDCDTLRNISASRAFSPRKKNKIIQLSSTPNKWFCNPFSRTRNSALAFDKREIPVCFLLLSSWLAFKGRGIGRIFPPQIIFFILNILVLWTMLVTANISWQLWFSLSMTTKSTSWLRLAGNYQLMHNVSVRFIFNTWVDWT